MDLGELEKKIKDTSFTTGVVRNRNLGYLVATNDELIDAKVPHSSLFQIHNGQVAGMDLQWMACSATVCYSPEEQFVAVAQQGGNVFSSGAGGSTIEQPIDSSDKFKRRGYIREVRGIAKGPAYAVGTCRQVYRREQKGFWVCIDNWENSSDDNISEFSFESIDGFDEKEIYVVGWEGEIWRYNGKKWKAIDSPTNLALHKVCCSDEGQVYAAGKAGVLLKGRGDKWSAIEHEVTEEDFWGLQWFQGKLHLSTMNFIYVLEDDELELIDFGAEDIPGSCYHLSAADGIMWSIGAKDVMEFDGNKWRSILRV